MTEVSLPVRRLSRRAKIALAVGVLAVVVIAAAASIIAVVSHRASEKHAVSYSSQVVLPFTQLKIPVGVAVDAAGNSYVADNYTNNVWKLPKGAEAPILLPFKDIKNPGGVAVDAAGTVYVTDEGNNRVLKLAAGASAPAVVPFT